MHALRHASAVKRRRGCGVPRYASVFGRFRVEGRVGMVCRFRPFSVPQDRSASPTFSRPQSAPPYRPLCHPALLVIPSRRRWVCFILLAAFVEAGQPFASSHVRMPARAFLL